MILKYGMKNASNKFNILKTHSSYSVNRKILFKNVLAECVVTVEKMRAGKHLGTK